MQSNLYQPKSVDVTEVTLTSKTGTTIELKYMYSDLNIHEDMFGNGITATMTLYDAQNLLKTVPIFGFETVEIAFGTPTLEEYRHTFIVYNIVNRSLLKGRMQVYTINMISPQVYTDRLTKVSKSYNGKLISDIVDDLQQQYLNSSFFELEPTKFNHQIIIPNWSPMEAIRWLSGRANATSYQGSNYMYYENKDGYHFTPIDKLVAEPAVIDYHVSPAHQRSPNSGDPGHFEYSFDIIQTNVEEYVFLDHIDTLESIMAGMYGNRLLTHNIIRKRFDTQDFSYTGSYMQYNHLSNNTAYNELLQFTAKTFMSDQAGTYDSPQSTMRFYPSGQGAEQYPNQVENWIQERLSRLKQIHAIKLIITVPGDSRRKVGDVVNFNLPSPEQLIDKEVQYDIYHRGNYLVTGLRHIITKTEYITKLELTKDSVFQPYP